MTADEFRKLALSLQDTEERAHMNHPDFRTRGKIFATLGYPSAEWAMVKLPPEEQQNYVSTYPDAFVPVKGKWGVQGATNVNLKAAKRTQVKKALEAAWSQLHTSSK
jgi:hypothetical protein